MVMTRQQSMLVAKRKRIKVNSRSVVFISIALGLVSGLAPTRAMAQQPDSFTTIASGLGSPRGLRFGPDGYLYVAEAGTGGKNSTVGTACQQVPAPVGPYTGGKTATITKIGQDGSVTTVASGFPSGLNAMGSTMGVADVAFLDGALYALVAGGGCSHGNPDSPSGVARVDRSTGQWNLIADIGAYLRTHPAKYESLDDFEPDGALYSMIAVDGILYIIEANHGQMLSVTKSGEIRQVIDVSASEGHIVPTSVAEREGTFYVGNLNLFPINPQWARILTISKRDHDDYDEFAPGFDHDRRGHHIVSSKAGFTTVVAVDFGPDGLVYALELSDAAGYPTLGAGKVVRVRRSGEIEDVITGLSLPTGMTFGPEGRLYISDLGAAAPGAGKILRFDIAPAW